MKIKKGFTLIELLVVIAIIAILAAILFPVFARAKVAAKQTQDISNLKNINMGNQIYLSDYDDTWVIWSSAKHCLYNPSLCTVVGTDINYDDGSAFGLRYMYPQMVNPYIKSGVTAGKGDLKDIWASPLSKDYFPTSKYLYGYNYYALGGFSGCDAFNAPAGCGSRPASWGPFADSSYNTAASGTSLQDAARTIAYTDGNILIRPPQYIIGGPSRDAAFIAVWGPADTGSGKLYNGNGTLETLAGLNSGATPPPAGVTRDWFTSSDLVLLTGSKTVVSYADGHVKVVPTNTLHSKLVKTDKWQGALSDNTGWARSW